MENQVQFKHKAPEQVRAEKTVEDIFQAARELSISEDDAKLTSRAVAKRSGYSIGTIYRYFEKLDDIFINIFMDARQKYINQCIDLIEKHPPDQRAEVLLEKIIDLVINGWNKTNTNALTFILKIFFRSAKEPQKLGMLSDSIIVHFKKAQQKDITNTFLELTEEQIRLRLRAATVALRSPFFENDPIAGTPMHKQISMEILKALFVKTENS